MTRLIEEGIKIICGRRGTKNLTKLSVKGIVRGEDGDLLILFHPHEPTCSSSSCTFYYHPKGEQLRCFETVRVKKADQYLALKMPSRIYNVYIRKHERVSAVRDSSVTFLIPNKQRIFKGRVENISFEGCKITGSIQAPLKKGETVCNLTMILLMKNASRNECRLHIPETTVVWAKMNQGQTEAFGVRFNLNGTPVFQKLSRHLLCYQVIA